ncbi:MAG: FIST N-terminal domain-containing protein [Candidatus Omnitrophota bacterium]|nr:FIST N-terminal domain-containing protein [Candidatus Omnitrophota bacterium]
MSIELDYIKAAKEAVEKAKISINAPNIDFALLFTTLEFSHPLVLQTTARLIGPIPLLGASSTSIISSLGPLRHGLMLILFSLGEGAYFNAACVKDIAVKTAFAAGEELGEKLLYGCKDVHRNLSVVFSSTDTAGSSNLVTGMQEKLGSSFPLVGGSLPKAAEHQENSVYCGSELLNDAACGILWGGKLNFGLGIEHGWQPLGKPRQITRAGLDTVNEIDGVAAVNLYKEYFAKEIPELKRELKRISVFYPLGIAVSEKKEYLLRSVSSIKNDGSLIFRGETPEGRSIRLMISSKEACLSSARQAAQTAMNNLRGKKVKFALVLNSSSRYALLGRLAGQEIKIVQAALGEEVPLAGIYTSAEQAPLASTNYSNLGKSYFHNNSIVVLAIAE